MVCVGGGIAINRLVGASVWCVCLRQLKLHAIKRQKVPKRHGLKKHQKNNSLACKKSSRFWNTKRTLM